MEKISVVNLVPIITLASLYFDDSLLPILPLDLIEEIFCRLPVKLLLQLRCVCKSWKSLISDPKFAKKHLSLSTTRHLYYLSYSDPLDKYIFTSYPLHPIFTNISVNFTRLEFPPHNYDGNYNPNTSDYYVVGCCNGILCLADDVEGFIILWNPFIEKIKELPPFQKQQNLYHGHMTYGFGFDYLTDNYKVVVLCYYIHDDNHVEKMEVKIHVLGTNIWKNIQEFPCDVLPIDKSGHFVGGAINWLVSKVSSSKRTIVSCNLRNESYQEILPPNYENQEVCYWHLGVLRDCLCLICGDDVWLMKEYGNKDSWTKLFTIPYIQDPRSSYGFTKVVNIFEDHQVLLEYIEDETSMRKSIVYDFKNNIFKFTEFESTPEVYVESLISPCF
ncbi:F-box/kelch-repeat protein At3g23880-like [Trifolium pratense]|uniref:F-box/kelch-repeat protein At3g23880-like n=1 Tax=Trifolium pratense TaxID=57577 RepID=UPI001E696906|nr:F-box/kelch-repeat protein At3g23880-like [Trifolium pratense]